MNHSQGTTALALRTRSIGIATLALALVASVLTLSLALAAPAHSGQKVRPEWGKTAAKNGFLKKRCKNYKYSYAITPPEGNWGLELFLRGPKGKPLAHDAKVIGQNPEKGTGTFRFCRPTTRPGVFKIRAKLSVQDEFGNNYREGWLPVTKFRLRNRR